MSEQIAVTCPECGLRYSIPKEYVECRIAELEKDLESMTSARDLYARMPFQCLAAWRDHKAAETGRVAGEGEGEMSDAWTPRPVSFISPHVGDMRVFNKAPEGWGYIVSWGGGPWECHAGDLATTSDSRQTAMCWVENRWREAQS